MWSSKKCVLLNEHCNLKKKGKKKEPKEKKRKKKTQKNLEKLEKHKKKTEQFDLNTFVISTHQKPTFIHGSEALPLSTIESIKLNQSIDLIRDMRLYNCIFNYYSSLIGL